MNRGRRAGNTIAGSTFGFVLAVGFGSTLCRLNQPPDQETALDGTEVLNDLARVFGAAARKAKVFLDDGITLTRQVRAQYRGHRIELLANRDLILADVEGRYGQFRLFYVNPRVRRPRYGTPAHTLDVSGVRHTIFNYHGKLSPAQADLVESEAFERLFAIIDPQEGEEINVSQRLVRTYLRRPSTRRVMAIIHGIVDLMPHEADWNRGGPFEELPESLRPLIPLVSKWGISDDGERLRRLNSCAASSLQKLVEAVVPLIPAIDHFLDTFGAHPTEEACALGDLAQAALEAQSILAGGAREP